MKQFKLLLTLSLLTGLFILNACSDEEPEIIPEYKLELTMVGQGEVSNSNELETYTEGSEIILTATPGEGWKFSGWSGDITSTENPLSVTFDEEKAITATFTEIQVPTYSLSLNTVGNGAVKTNPALTTYAEGSKVLLTASADEGWEFSGWSGDVTSSDNPLTITTDSDKSLTATFTELPTYSLTLTANSNGSINVSPAQEKYAAGTQITITAIPNERYEFKEWLGSINSTENPLTITINSNLTILPSYNGVPLILDDNGITVRVWGGVVGESYELNGQTYKVVDEDMLRAMINNKEDVSKVVTTKVKNMDLLFASKTDFNQDISSWDVSNVISMYGIFNNASSFNQDISHWNVSNVRTMSNAFNRAENFNQDISSWDVSKVSNMRGMFYQAISFNQDLNNWNVSSVTSMYTMFNGALAFNGNISNWNVSSVTDMTGMFGSAASFNQPIGNWNVGNVTTMSTMFAHAESFNQDISNWNTAKVTDMYKMFLNDAAFNQDISNWNVSSVTQMREMFHNATSFNQNLSSWTVTQVTACYQFALNATAWTHPKPNLVNCIQ